jgi:ligand-binding sensor domain-containing protein
VAARRSSTGSPITAMLADHDGNLWIGSNAGWARFREAR